MHTSRRVSRTFAAGLIALLAGQAYCFQDSQPKPVRPTPPRPTAPDAPAPVAPGTPATPGKPATTPPAGTAPMTPDMQPTVASKRGDPTVGPYITQTLRKDKNLTVRVRLASDSSKQKERVRDPHTGQTADMPKVTPFDMKSMGVIWPILPATSFSAPIGDGVSGKLRLNGQVMSETMTPLEGYPCGVRLARWDVKADDGQVITCRQVQLDVTVAVSLFKTDFDEASALKVPWPTGPWPKEVASCMAPQLYVETALDENNKVVNYDDAPLADAITQWLAAAGVTDPKKVTPVALAKILTARVWGLVQISDQMISSGHTGPQYGEITNNSEFAGVIVQPPSSTLASGRGSRADVAALLCAAFKKAGLPARTVICWDSGDTDKDEKAIGARRSNSRGLRYWVEFPVFDEDKNTLNWVPIDIYELRKSGSRAQPLERPWRYFGTHPDANMIVPFAFHFHPPTDVVSYGAPAFWGWFVTPQAPAAADQFLTFSSAAASVRGGDTADKGDDSMNDPKKQEQQKKDQKKKDDEKKKKRGY
ncbi:MAG: transglutaminase domain-containing protein [Planctomycetes bacterium]|nr:transglutaminase domain-containing protein [Planctomycetota bacterium]